MEKHIHMNLIMRIFPCDVYYDLYVDWKDGNKTYNTSVTYTYVKTNGAWYVADFILN